MRDGGGFLTPHLCVPASMYPPGDWSFPIFTDMDSPPSAPSPDTANHAIFHPRPFFRPPEIAHPSALSCGLRPLASSPPPSHSDDGKDSGARRGRGSRPARPGRGARSPAASVRQPRLLGAGDGSNGIEATWARRSSRRRCTNASRVPSPLECDVP